MTRSIFDPSGDETEHSGSRFSPQDAKQSSKMPPNLVDREVPEAEEEQADREQKPPEADADR